MKSKEIKELIDFISSTGLAEVNLETDEIKLHIKRTASATVVEQPLVSAAPVVSAPAPSVAATPAPKSTEAPAAETKSSGNLIEVKSPMIGTFYRSANPESDPFVNVGDTINAGDVVCIIEAMKLFNEIESEVTGKVVKVLVDNASPVEYDQPLFLVDPS